MHAQNLQLIDSLKSHLKEANGVSRFNLLNNLAWEYRASYPDSTLYFAKEAQNLADKINLKKGGAKSFNFIGVAYNNKGERMLAFQSYNEALKISVDQHDSVQLAYANINLGRLFFEQGLLARAYDYYNKALVVFESLTDRSGLAYTYQSLGNLYKVEQDFLKAESNYLKALEIRLSLGNTRDIMAAFLITGRLYQENHVAEKAIQFLYQADSAGRVINDEINLAEIKINIATSYLERDILDTAELICVAGLKAIAQTENRLILPHAHLVMGQVKFKMKNFNAAYQHFNAALTIALKTKDMTSKMEAYYWLWKLAERRGNTIGTLENYNHYLILKDSLKDLDLTRQVERLQFENKIAHKEQENEILKAGGLIDLATIQKQRLQNILLAIVVVFSAIFVFVQWINIKARQKVNTKLSEQNDELLTLNEEKDTLMSFVAHDLKSPMNRIQGVSYLLEREEPLTEMQRTYIKIIKDSTQAELDIIKDLLDAHKLEENIVPHYTRINVNSILTKRVEAMQQIASLKTIQLELKNNLVSTLKVNTDEDYFKRILDNLISNAIKFSNPLSTIDIGAETVGSKLTIYVKDNGPGFSENDKLQLFQKFKKLSARPTGGESSNGLGLAIVKTLVDRLKGNIELVSETGKGSKFIVQFALN